MHPLVKKMVTSKHQEFQDHHGYRILTRDEIEQLCNIHPAYKKAGLIHLIKNISVNSMALFLAFIDPRVWN